jgi:hypothetical protein
MRLPKLGRWFGITPSGTAQANRRRLRPRLEALEDRTLPAPFLVSNLNDSGAGSLRAAIAAANAAAPGDRGAGIEFHIGKPHDRIHLLAAAEGFRSVRAERGSELEVREGTRRRGGRTDRPDATRAAFATGLGNAAQGG